MSKLTRVIQSLVEPLLAELGYELVDLQYRREGGRYILRLFIDHPEGINISDCEKASHVVGAVLDQEDCIPNHYYLEVSSPGLERPLKKEADFIRFIGRKVKIRTYAPIDGQRNYSGQLIGCSAGKVKIQTNDKQLKVIPQSQIASARLVFNLGENEGAPR